MAFPIGAFEGKAVEPVAISGGPIFVPLSLLATADSEGEFAAQLAHAMAHIALRHGSRLATREQLMKVANKGLENGRPAAQVEQAALVGRLMLGRQFELQADQVAVGIVAETGYDPAAMARYVTRIQKPDGTTASKRLETVNSAIRELPTRTYSAATGEFEHVKMLAGNVR